MKISFKKILYAPIVIFLAMTLISSCNTWLQNVSTDDRIMEKDLFSTQKGFLIALNGVYIDIMSSSLYGKDLMYGGTDIMAQYWNTDVTDGGHTSNSLATFAPSAKSSLATGIWNKAYPLLNNLNNLLEHCENNEGVLSDNYYKLIKGESLAMRALIHFEMYRFYGPSKKDNTDPKTIPYADSPEFKVRPFLAASELIKRIYEDLDAAEALLKEVDPVIEFGPRAETAELESNDFKFRNIRMNYYAVKALIARVAMFVGDEDKAYEYASSVINDAVKDKNHFKLTPRSDLEISKDPDRIFSSEILFGTYNKSRSTEIYNRYFGNAVSKNNILLMHPSAIDNLYENLSADYRRIYLWEEKTNSDLERIVCFIKFVRNSPEDYIELVNVHKNYYIPVLKISEMYLICAEVKYEENPELAASYLSELREARNISEVNTNSDLLEVIRCEYAKEFIGEGQLFWFYKRNKYTSIPNISQDPTLEKTVAMDTDQYYFTVPQNELDNRI